VYPSLLGSSTSCMVPSFPSSSDECYSRPDEEARAARPVRDQGASSAWTTSQGMTAYGSGVTKSGQ
jgi:hypothetical protein